MITNIHDLIIAIDNAVYGETLIVNENMYDLINNLWSCILFDNITIKNLHFVLGGVYDN